MSAAILIAMILQHGVVAECPELDFSSELRESINPVSRLEQGAYVFAADGPLSLECLRQRVCEVNAFTRKHYQQSYYVSLESKGGKEMERRFPEATNAAIEARGDDRMIYLNNFCQLLGCVSWENSEVDGSNP